jgi:hypothetical protein
LILSATIALAQSLNCTFQSIGVLSNFWSASDSVWTPGDEVSTTQERVDALTGVAVARWWGWQLTKVGFVDFWDILRGGAVQDAAKMNNTDT